MKKLNYFFGAVAMAIAMTMASCSVDDLPVPDIFDGDDLSTAIANHTKIVNGVPTVDLPAGVSLTMNSVVELNAPLAINGNAANPAIIKIGPDAKFIGGVLINNAIIDASEMNSPLITLGTADQPEWAFISAGIKNVQILGLKKALIYSGCKNFDAVIYVENCRVELAADATTFDFTKGSFPSVLEITNSTFWAPQATSKSFFSSQSGQKAAEMGEDALEQFNFENSTFYNLAKSKNFFTHRQSGQKWLAYTAKDCIFVNCGKSGQVVRGMNQGQGSANPVWNISGNVFNFDGADTSADESTGDEEEPVKDSKAVVVNFADADNGNFTQSDVKAGDPFWF